MHVSDSVWESNGSISPSGNIPVPDQNCGILYMYMYMYVECVRSIRIHTHTRTSLSDRVSTILILAPRL